MELTPPAPPAPPVQRAHDGADSSCSSCSSCLLMELRWPRRCSLSRSLLTCVETSDVFVLVLLLCRSPEGVRWTDGSQSQTSSPDT
ncbi:hypothetical protein EYF80_065396 [Liparis tanakae]|uniref:Uncharacterized protein n=1 Tax=Liparis tanakae TaxID=230148 RepID=A0A4Z2E6Q3_9TELE|nr:hypothetical protein EYF80_065396 [Liparis tanakae]